MPLCRICWNDASNTSPSDKPRLDRGERCSRCNRTPSMEEEDLQEATEL